MSLNYPQLYALGIRNTFFSRSMFVLTVIEGVFAAIIIYFIPYCAMQYSVQPDGRELVDHKTFGVVVESVLTVAVTLRVGNLSVCMCVCVKVFSSVKLLALLSHFINLLACLLTYLPWQWLNGFLRLIYNVSSHQIFCLYIYSLFNLLLSLNVLDISLHTEFLLPWLS